MVYIYFKIKPIPAPVAPSLIKDKVAIKIEPRGPGSKAIVSPASATYSNVLILYISTLIHFNTL